MTNFLTNFKAVKEAAVVSTDLLPFTEETLRACARNACGRYNTSWACPPASEKAEEMKKFCLSFPSALLFSTCGSLEDSFDIEGMNAARSRIYCPADRRTVCVKRSVRYRSSNGIAVKFFLLLFSFLRCFIFGFFPTALILYFVY